ncbi:DUF4142 domain-containing protein [Enterovirga sp.]|jgi:putative membrane protein|uniref:DUF4142 domain-containing protein n=1 Tax=Enterovirga sp. TaxID=2026350 RepID=UPI00263633D8|nr:DUF4142 domain-containing protein [Enterovirga sp.]MDB5592007.1 hypothetical protein [Enterovirga sp.]
MDRRMILLALGAAAAAGPVAAQTGQTGQTGQSGQAGQTGQAGAGQRGAMGNAEMEHARKTLMAGTVALQTSDIAMQKASNAGVKQFAKFEHDEQTTIAEVLRSMDASLKPAPDPKMADMVQKLQSAQAGAAFDKMYVTGQIEGHQNLLAIQEEYLKGGKDVHHTGMAKLARAMIREHLVHLGELQKSLG